jgi:hypothetical protein
MGIKTLKAVFLTALIVCLYGVGNASALGCLHPTLAIALDSLESSDEVEVTTVEVASWETGASPTEADPDDNIYYSFMPKNTTPKTAFIIIPGGNSDPEGLAPTAHQIAAAGYLVIIVPMPDCVSMPNGGKRADKIISDFENIEKWVIGGHSVGAVSACLYAAGNDDIIDGVVIWASIPPGDMTALGVKILTVYGSEDGRNPPESVALQASLLPVNSIFVKIEGGNHTQFAYYDTSPDLYLEGDKPATITLEEQQNIIVNATVDFLSTSTLTSPYKISGTVTEDSTGLSGVTVTLDVITDEASHTTINIANLTAGDGTYSFTELTNGSYTVIPSLKGYSFSPANTPVTIAGADETEIDFVVAEAVPLYPISGTVSNCNLCHPGDAARVTITLSGVAPEATKTTADGSYNFTVPDGSYTVTPRMANHPAMPLIFDPTSTDVTVAGAARTGIDFAAAAEVLDEDIDDDGVLNEADECDDTPVGEIVDPSGCSIDQLVPCEGPREDSRKSRRNHGRYVAALKKVLKRFVSQGLITKEEIRAFMKEKASSDCGKIKNVKKAYTCETDRSKTGYDRAAELDDCLLLNAQTMTTHIESENIEVLGTDFEDFGVFESNFAHIDAEEKTVSPISIFFDEDMSAYPKAPDTINGAFVTKMVSKDKIESYFDININGDQGTCSDIQEQIYDNVFYKVLTREQRLRYSSEGKSLTILPDHIDNRGWVPKDTATLITHEGNDYFFEPYSLYISIDDPVDVDELLKGTKYCKLLSHQTILSWMLDKSFEDDPVLLTPYDACNEPSSFVPQGGSCIFYFRQAQSYYCSDYTGPFFNLETGPKKCEDRLDTSGGLPVFYSTSPCSERTEEIVAYIPESEYAGFTGACVIHCQEENEFIWNRYEENAEFGCGDFPFFTPEEIDEIKRN